jgi:thymidine phosphorylase
MDSQEKASELAQNIIRVAAAAGLPTTALVTDMNQVLGHTVGHSLEVLESILFLTGQQQDSRLLDCTLSLAAEMLYLSKLADSVDDARAQAKAALDNGRAAEKFQQMVSAHGGPADCVEKPQQHLSFTPIQYPVYPHQEGFIAGIDTRAVGQLLVSMGGGRIRVDQPIDPAVGISDMAGIGSEVNAHQPLATIHANERAQAEAYAQQLLDCITISTDVVKATGSVVAEQHRGR